MEALLTADGMVALLTLTALEIVLGIDNLVFLSIITSRLPPDQRPAARRYGIALACISRLLLLLSLSWLAGMKEPILHLLGFSFSVRDLVLILGGLFLLVKATLEIHAAVEGVDDDPNARPATSYWGAIAQIAIIDIVFSLDSVITAVGMVNNITIMVIAILISVVMMLVASNPIAHFIDRHPTIKMLALSFLILVGVALIADGFHKDIPRQYLYFAMAFSAGVEALNGLTRKKKLARRPDGE